MDLAGRTVNLIVYVVLNNRLNEHCRSLKNVVFY